MGKQNIREKDIPNGVEIRYLKPEMLSRIIYFFRTKGKKNAVYNIFLYLLIIISDYIIWTKELRRLKKENYKLTVTFFQYLPGYITKIKNSKHIIVIHGSLKSIFIGIRKYFKANFINKLKKFDYICGVSKELEKDMKKEMPDSIEKIDTLYNPITVEKIMAKSLDKTELTQFEKKIIEEQYICSVGRLDESQKDFTTLIEAYAELIKEKKIEKKLVIIGDGPDKKRLEKMVQEMGVENNVYFLGKKENPYIWMKNSKCFILSSKFEGFPTVLIEALILRTPVISSNCKTGPDEILESGKYGYLFEIANKDELKTKILAKPIINQKIEWLYKFDTNIEEILEKIS